ncbi:MerR family transcriptional regulator [Periweissella beninensis]|uniref:MerR family transcriptional regulator n=1 Tax=Periweissella beninensis TaxID=504936 RepID=A0ABT0VIL5_9LACO|nr:MerR family transcriptional regulator [Periweissella beninensis]MBM7543946.1 DNA-binding transcriptional MerR regulator [Periweissella beninensis]MCM2437672.1 MerR family transcriptional regulator [Periweissella beninensis]MCT4396134.1 MerR family transcriptional regulator [Periweissella beninensis]
MANDPIELHIMKKIFNAEKLFFRIGELSSMTGVSTRQLRYWEQKNYIHSIQRDDEQSARVFHFKEYARVSGIKYFLDQGYSLQAAVKQVNQYIDVSHFLHKFVKEGIKTVKTSNNTCEIDLGWLDEAKTQHLYARLEDEKFKYYVE